MFKRLFWLMVGAGFGFGASFWVQRAVRSTVERYRPERLSRDVSGAAKRFGADLKAAVAEGRDAMREYERDAAARLGSNGSNA